jgi:hypothetical protein
VFFRLLPSFQDYWDLKNVMDTTVEEAVDNNKREIAKDLKKSSLSHEDIAKGTGLSIDEIKQLQSQFHFISLFILG